MTELNQYTMVLTGEFDYVDEVMSFEATCIEDAVVHVLYSDEFEDYGNHVTVDYYATEANICVHLPFGIRVVYNVGEIDEEEVD